MRAVHLTRSRAARRRLRARAAQRGEAINQLFAPPEYNEPGPYLQVIEQAPHSPRVPSDSLLRPAGAREGGVSGWHEAMRWAPPIAPLRILHTPHAYSLPQACRCTLAAAACPEVPRVPMLVPAWLRCGALPS